VTKPKSKESSDVEGPAVASSTRKSASTVTVACKIPMGLELQLCRETTWFEDTPSGSRERKRYEKVGATVIVRGPSYPVGTVPPGMPPKPQIVGGYALTFGVNADFFEEWMAQNAQNPIVVNKMIFAHAKADATRSEARENRTRLSGLEPLVPDNDPRIPRPITTGVTAVETADEMEGRILLEAAE